MLSEAIRWVPYLLYDSLGPYTIITFIQRQFMVEYRTIQRRRKEQCLCFLLYVLMSGKFSFLNHVFLSHILISCLLKLILNAKYSIVFGSFDCLMPVIDDYTISVNFFPISILVFYLLLFIVSFD